MGFNLSVAVTVGFIALAGGATETGVIMLVYLDHALAEIRAGCDRAGRTFIHTHLRRAIMAGAVGRVRPRMMTVVAIMAGLLPILWSTGSGSETMLTLVLNPAVYCLAKGWGLTKSDPSMESIEGAGTPLAAE